MSNFNQVDINRVIKGTSFWTDRVEYVFVQLDRKDFKKLMSLLAKCSNEFVEVINDRNEFTLIITKETWMKQLGLQFKPQSEVLPIAIISCDVVEPAVTGYLYTLLSALSPNNIGVYVQGSYTSDHIFVDFENLDIALQHLNELKSKL